MGQPKALKTRVEESSPESAVEPESQRQPAGATTITRSTAAPATGKRTERSSHPFEVVGLVVVSAVLHAGAAYGFYSSEKVPPQRRLSSVDIDFVRPPEVEPPKPEPPPPPPPVEEPVHRQVVKRTVVSEAKPEPVPVQPAPPVDMGIEAASDDDGNLVAGKGGSGIAVPPPQPSPKAMVAAAPAPLVQAHEGANYSKNPRPAYPARAKREGWEGRAVLRVQVLTNGRPGQVTVQTSAGRQQLDDAALAAVKGWTFVPARRGGAPTSGWVTVPIEFRLR